MGLYQQDERALPGNIQSSKLISQSNDDDDDDDDNNKRLSLRSLSSYLSVSFIFEC
jgi:hypothetical protein